MRHIDLSSWPRRQHFEFFNAFDYPQFNLCAPVDISRFYPLIKQRQLSATVSIVYLLAKAANAIPEFRYRIRGRQVVEHDLVHPAATILTEGDLFSFCTLPFVEDFDAFARQAAELIAQGKTHPTLDDAGRDDLLFLSSIPWVAFTGLMHPIHMHPADSTPRISWGKFFAEGGRLKMPLSVQGHHALMDGIHVGRYFTHVQTDLDQPERLFANVISDCHRAD